VSLTLRGSTCRTRTRILGHPSCWRQGVFRLRRSSLPAFPTTACTLRVQTFHRTASPSVEQTMAKPNYSFEKRQRELAKKKKKEEKEQRKAASRESPGNATAHDRDETRD